MTNYAEQFPLLFAINDPADLRQFSETQLVRLADELRQYVILALNEAGGHFAANLGTIELAIAVHYVFQTPDDRLIWDVGHQAYPHKILTGRRDRIATIRQPEGLAPFCKREESVYDFFGAGHSSTSIGVALGAAIANAMDQNPRKCVAIIGDDGLTAGMAFEALNHAGHNKKDVLVILNDNDMSISPNVGGLNNYLARMLTSPTFVNLKEGGKKVLAKMPPVLELVKRTETHMKGMLAPSSLFEELGFHYVGPIDGHDLPTLVKTLQNMREMHGPQLLHIKTIKGKGYTPAEADPVKYHAVKPGFYDIDQGKKEANKKIAKPTYSDIFGDWLCDMAAQDPNLIGITPAMCEGSGMVRFAKEFPERYHDVAIAEQHAVTLAAGMAAEGKKPVVAIYSTFLQRAYDQLIHDVALQNLDVTFAIDRAGYVGGDGPTHAGSFDLSFLRCIPNMMIAAPADENECRQLLYTAYSYSGPSAVRYPRGEGPGVAIHSAMTLLTPGKAEIRRQGKEIAILAFGAMVTPAVQAGEELNATVINMRFVKPFDAELIRDLAKTHRLLVTVEENTILGGAGSAINEFLLQENIAIPILNLGLPDKFLEHGNPAKMLTECGLDAKGIKQSIQRRRANI